jgi:hypothetical protein
LETEFLGARDSTVNSGDNFYNDKGCNIYDKEDVVKDDMGSFETFSIPKLLIKSQVLAAIADKI